ncbi:MAG: hypothetical protein ACRELY_06455 [Polyangiaceae bacterium]
MNGRRFRIAAALVALTASACGGGGGAKAKDATDTKSSDWFSKLVDDQTDSEIRMRPNDFATDSFAGPLVDTADKQASSKLDNPAAAAMIKVIEKSDVVVVAVRKMKPADAVVVIGGVPSGTNPDGVVDSSGAPVWKKADSSPAGLDEWQLTSGSPDDQAGRLAVAGGSTWVFGTGPAVARMNEALSGGSASAYAPDAAGGGKDLFDITLAGDGLDTIKNDPRAPLPPPIASTLKHVSIVFDGGTSPGFHAKLTYADEPSAAQADQLLNAMAARVPMMKVIGDLKIAHSGSDLTADLPVSPAVRDLVIASASTSGSGDASMPPPSINARPQEIKPKKKKKGH